MKVALNPDMINRLNQKYSGNKNGGSDDEKIKFYSIRGKNPQKYVFRILPLTDEMNGFLGKFIGTHLIKLEGDDKWNALPCVESYGVKDAICPVCETLRELENSGVDISGFWKFKSNEEVAVKVLMISAPDETNLPLDKLSVLKVPVNVFKEIASKYMDPDEPDILDPNTGRAVVIQRKEGDKRWSITLMDSSMPQSGLLGGSEDNRNTLLEANVKTNLNNIYKLPTDEKMMQLKELAKRVKEVILKAKSTVDNATTTMINNGAVSTNEPPVMVSKNIPIVNPLQQPTPVMQQVVPQPTLQVQPAVMTMSQPMPVAVSAVSQPQPNLQVAYATNPVDVVTIPQSTPVQQPVATVTVQQGQVVNIDYDNLTPEQSAIIEKYRDGCTNPCFGHHDKCNLLEYTCMADPYSTNCVNCIKELTGIDKSLVGNKI